MNTISNDRELIGRYVGGQSEDAFKELFRKHFSLVYGSARRITRDPDLACDVAQCVFHQFARKAGSLAPDVHLGGWLYRASVFEASKLVRSECRRRCREMEAGILTEGQSRTDMISEDGVSLEEQLDQALGRLGADDRKLVLLRFWHRMTARQIAKILGLTEAAAQKRLTRALEKLRSQVQMNGLVPDVAVVTGSLQAMLSQIAPSTQAAKVSYLMDAMLHGRRSAWTTRFESFLYKMMHAHRPAVTSGLVALNIVLWAGLYQPAQTAWSTQAESGSRLTLVNGWRNLSMGFGFLVDSSFTTLGIYPANTPRSGTGFCL